MHAYGTAIGTLKVGVSTSATGPFTSVFNQLVQFKLIQILGTILVLI